MGAGWGSSVADGVAAKRAAEPWHHRSSTEAVAGSAARVTVVVGAVVDDIAGGRGRLRVSSRRWAPVDQKKTGRNISRSRELERE